MQTYMSMTPHKCALCRLEREPTTVLRKVMEYDEQWCLGLFLLELKETQGEVVEGQQYSHTSSSTKNNHNFL